MRQTFLVILIALAGCAAPFPADVTPREAFVKYPGGYMPNQVQVEFVPPLGVKVTITKSDVNCRRR